MSIRDANVVLIEVARCTIRAGLGLHDLLKTPFIVGPIGCNSEAVAYYSGHSCASWNTQRGGHIITVQWR